jgi:esterase
LHVIISRLVAPRVGFHNSTMQRKTLRVDGIALSYLDAGGAGAPLVALHAYWMESSTWIPLAEALAPEWRLIALDQRGHGHSDKPADLSWDAFIGDLDAFLGHLRLTEPVALIGNSHGGMVAFRFAARYPQRVSAMVIEESPAVEDAHLDFMRSWEGVFPTREALLATIGERLAWSVEPSIRKVEGGFTLVFSPRQLADALAGLNGDYWADWLATRHPVLLVAGAESKAVDGTLLREMAQRRADTQLEIVGKAGHIVHHDAPLEFAKLTRTFLEANGNRA